MGNKIVAYHKNSSQSIMGRLLKAYHLGKYYDSVNNAIFGDKITKMVTAYKAIPHKYRDEKALNTLAEKLSIQIFKGGELIIKNNDKQPDYISAIKELDLQERNVINSTIALNVLIGKGTQK